MQFLNRIDDLERVSMYSLTPTTIKGKSRRNNLDTLKVRKNSHTTSEWAD